MISAQPRRVFLVQLAEPVTDLGSTVVLQARVSFHIIPARHQPLYGLAVNRMNATKVETKIKVFRHMVGVPRLQLDFIRLAQTFQAR